MPPARRESAHSDLNAHGISLSNPQNNLQAKADKPALDVNAAGKDLLARAQENGFNGTAVKVGR